MILSLDFRLKMLKDKWLLTNQSFKAVEDKNTKLYPKCDESVWLRSCEKEVLKPIRGTVRGSIPQWLSGCLLRNGPGSLNVGELQYHHLFDSAALIHKYEYVVSYFRRQFLNNFLPDSIFLMEMLRTSVVSFKRIHIKRIWPPIE